MDSNVLSFNFENTHDVRVVMDDGEPWVVGPDIAKAAGVQVGNLSLSIPADKVKKRHRRGLGYGRDFGGNVTVIHVDGLIPALYRSSGERAFSVARWLNWLKKMEFPKAEDTDQSPVAATSPVVDGEKNASDVSVFNYNGANEIRTITGEDGEPWFVAKDVCDVLGTRTKDIPKILDEDEVDTIVHTDSMGREQGLKTVNESGLYSLILRSRKPEAKAFKKWITSEVLPSIRKKGGYMVALPNETPEQVLARAANLTQEAIKRRDERHEKDIRVRDDEIAELKSSLVEMKHQMAEMKTGEQRPLTIKDMKNLIAVGFEGLGDQISDKVVGGVSEKFDKTGANLAEQFRDSARFQNNLIRSGNQSTIGCIQNSTKDLLPTMSIMRREQAMSISSCKEDKEREMSRWRVCLEEKRQKDSKKHFSELVAEIALREKKNGKPYDTAKIYGFIYGRLERDFGFVFPADYKKVYKSKICYLEAHGMLHNAISYALGMLDRKFIVIDPESEIYTCLTA